MQCVRCGGVNAVTTKVEVRRSGLRYRRYHCRDCDHRWSTLMPLDVSYKFMSNFHRRRFTRAQVERILVSPLSQSKLAKEYGVGKRAIYKIRTGRTYREIYEEVRGLTAKATCSRCVHWTDHCTFDWPEAGGSFADECTFYEER